ncbi:Ig-like domain-containing protein [Bacillus sp. FJAT-49736]|uniref:tandem-95 repeat protein n=1 Tax=Bacillus sp. FJAT-49736 TaxID=2833582 RepID=UPI001BC904C5|nr:Ig-like domain-containing protein [Bacillus sp. FJAT-49736]MBS4174273.1 tandem-95 repeat protein [Bacillus sp. FJAT-49736]
MYNQMIHFFTKSKKIFLPLLGASVIAIFPLTSNQHVKVHADSNPRISFVNGAEWMKSKATKTGDTISIDFSNRFTSYLDPSSIQLNATTEQESVSLSTNQLILNMNVNHFGDSKIKVTATDQQGRKVIDQFKISISKIGDINGDGIVNPSDALLIYQVINGKTTLNEEQLKLLDIDGDGIITSADASLLMSKYVGKPATSIANNNYIIQLSDINDAPLVNTDSFDVDEDQTLNTNLSSSILNNDFDIEGNTLTAIKVKDPTHGKVTLRGDGTFSYIPNDNFFGEDQFTYTVNDGMADSEEQTVNIHVHPVNDAPVANEDEYTVNEDETLQVDLNSSILLNDTDIESDLLKAIKVSNPSHGTLTLHEDGTFTYDPDANFNGTDEFTYKANDGTADSNVQTVVIYVIAVNDPPVANKDDFTVIEGETLEVDQDHSILLNDEDVEHDSLMAILVKGPSHGTLDLKKDGTFTYTPEASFVGKDQFTYKANDGTDDSNEQTVTIYVKKANEAPTVSNVGMTGNFTAGEMIHGQYTYADNEQDPEGTSKYQWYRSTQQDGSDKEAISGATGKDYTIQDEDENHYLFFEVTPVALSGRQTGQAVLSGVSEKVKEGDKLPPVLMILSPEKNASDVAIDSDLSATFDETIVGNDGKISIYKASDDSLVTSYSGNDTSHITIENHTITIHHSALEFGTSYYILFERGAITDVRGNAFTGKSNKSDWAFTTSIQETPATVTATPTSTLMESSLRKGNSVTLVLSGDTFKQSISARDFRLNNAPQGLSIGSVNYINDESVQVVFVSDGTDFDTDFNNFSINILSSATVKGKTATSNTMKITAEIELPSAFFSEYLDGGNGRIAVEVFPGRVGGADGKISGLSIDVYQWNLKTNARQVITQTLFEQYPNMDYVMINSIFYDYMDLTNAAYYNDEMYLDMPGNCVTTGFVLKQNGQVVDILGDPNATGPKEILPNGGTLERLPRLMHGSSDGFYLSQWTLYPIGTYQYITHYNY